MKKTYSIIAGLLMSTIAFLPQQVNAQAPEKMSYQAVVRDGSNNLVTSAIIGMQITILQGSSSGTAVYVEMQTPTSNTNGLVSLEIGSGTVVNGDFFTIDWSNGPYFIKTETDPTGGTNYTITGTSELLSVPYALYAATAGNNLPGPTGPPGANGQDGVDGLSAYQVWLNLDNTGTEQDFIESLVGPQGEPGTSMAGYRIINTIFDQSFSIAPGTTVTGSIQGVNKNHIIINFFPSYNEFHNVTLSLACYDSNNVLLELYVEQLIYRRDRNFSLREDFTRIETEYFNITTFNRTYSSVTGQNGTAGEAKGDIKIWSSENIDHIEYSIQSNNLNANFPSTRTPNLKIFTFN